MPTWGWWLVVGALGWILVAVLITLALGRFLTVTGARLEDRDGTVPAPAFPPETVLVPPETVLVQTEPRERRRILVVDDDPGIRMLLRTTLAVDEFAVEEARSAEEAAGVARFWSPAVVILDVGLPGMDGLTFSRELKRNPAYGGPRVVLLTGADTLSRDVEAAGADALLHKPFSPLELVAALDRVSAPAPPFVLEPAGADGEQLLVYAADLSRLLEIERTQRRTLQQAYRQTVTALADALEAKDPVTGLHALRVQHFAVELAGGLDPHLLEDPSVEYGFLLHDVGKIGIPDPILQKRGPLTAPERRLMQQHSLIGAEMLRDVALLQGEGLKIVRSHHERWDGTGYPDRLAGPQIPLGARIFALVDALDAMTSERPYRRARTWEEAIDEILSGSGSQFDPGVVGAFAGREARLRRIAEELAEQAA